MRQRAIASSPLVASPMSKPRLYRVVCSVLLTDGSSSTTSSFPSCLFVVASLPLPNDTAKGKGLGFNADMFYMPPPADNPRVVSVWGKRRGAPLILKTSSGKAIGASIIGEFGMG